MKKKSNFVNIEDVRGNVIASVEVPEGIEHLQYQDLRGLNLSGANLVGHLLTNADLRGVDLSGADLQNATLYRARLQGANLRGANLRNAMLMKSCVNGADFSGANLERASVSPGFVANSSACFLGSNLLEVVESEVPSLGPKRTGLVEDQPHSEDGLMGRPGPEIDDV